MALRAPQFDQAAATDRGVDIHVCSVDIHVDVRPGRVFNGADMYVLGLQWWTDSQR